jgi:hypothetical protein
MAEARAVNAAAHRCCRVTATRSTPSSTDDSRPRLCESCGTRAAKGARVCMRCGGTRLAPPWVLARRTVARGFDVRITESSAQYGTPHKRISLSRWWPGVGARASLNVNTPDELSAVIAACREFASELRWPLDAAADAPARAERALASTSAVLARLADDPAASRTLSALLERWSLQQIGDVATEVRRRLDAIALLERVASDERTYELRTEHSIHRVLERSLWLIDERYWLLTSNAQLRTLIGAGISAHAKLRPDFTCATGSTEGAIVELKRPRHALQVEDLNQVERYLVLAEQHAPKMRWRALLVGGRLSAELRRTSRHRPAVEVRTFADVAADARRRYRDYLRIVVGRLDDRPRSSSSVRTNRAHEDPDKPRPPAAASRVRQADSF